MGGRELSLWKKTLFTRPGGDELSGMVEITLSYKGGLNCAAVHGPSGRELTTDAPKDNRGKGESFSPTDLTATSLAACMLTTMGIVAQLKEIEMSGARAVVRKHMTTEPPRRIAKLGVELDIPLPADHPERTALENAAHRCPVALSLHPDVLQAVTIRWNG